jgi:hypothetical protein
MSRVRRRDRKYVHIIHTQKVMATRSATDVVIAFEETIQV